MPARQPNDDGGPRGSAAAAPEAHRSPRARSDALRALERYEGILKVVESGSIVLGGKVSDGHQSEIG